MLFVYRAKPSAGGAITRGELAADSPADVRAALRRIGLQPLDVRPARRAPRVGLPIGVRAPLERHLRARRRAIKADLFDSLATMLEAGVPLAEALTTMTGTAGGRARLMLRDLQGRVEDGAALAEAMAELPAWFDPAERAMVAAGQRSGELGSVLAAMSRRHQRSGELAGRLAGALTYPAVVSVVGLGVVIFLATRTLPNLTGILESAGLEPPALTRMVMALGRTLAASWLWLLPLAAMLAIGLSQAPRLFTRLENHVPGATRALNLLPPRVLRQTLLAQALLTLAELVRTGVTLVEACRATAPTLAGPGARELGRRLESAAERLERGEAVSGVLDDPKWFDAELRRLVAVGEAAGELDATLERLGARLQRRARRAIDRLTAVLEPAVILLLAAGVGAVVLAAVLPLVRLQEVL